MSATRTRPVDDDQREAAVRERDRNVVIEAGAGTGKTSTLVRRLVQLVAPDSGVEPWPMRRIAAITFTRRAAGELSLRIREELLRGLADAATPEDRCHLLQAALGQLDTAYVGTIHSFADRLLRMKPAETRLSPNYEVVEDEEEEELLRQTYQLLLTGAERGSLADEMADAELKPLAREAGPTVMDAIRAGILTQTREMEHASHYGLDALVAGLIRQRDVQPVLLPTVDPDLDAIRRHMAEFAALSEDLDHTSRFGRWVKQMAARMAELMQETDPAILFAEMASRIQERRQSSQRPNKKDDCQGDSAVWGVWKALHEGGKHREGRDAPLGDDLTMALCAWFGQRLVRLSPVVVALYERVKARRGVIDQIDLLLKLRDLLRDDLESRRFYQNLFSHILVDEFQDTDPLQAEIVQFLCEREPAAATASEVELADGRLTLVGDPKQSIYRFRRADVEMYDRVIAKLGPNALRVELIANFRSAPSLTTWYNSRFPGLLGESEADEAFDPDTGRVFHRDLAAGRADDQLPCVHVMRFDLADGVKANASAYREIEAEALAHYVRWLVLESGQTIMDRAAGEERRIRYEDVCVLAIATTNLPLLFAQLDHMDVPYAATGGTLFLGDPLQKQFILGLRAVADPDDGVAQAALMRPPFFAVDLRDVFASQKDEAGGPGRERVVATKAWLEELRARRFERAPGATARELLEWTGMGRAVALGPNGGQRVQRLREICHLLEKRAAEEGLDYDSATALLRAWVTAPAKLDAPRPVAESAMQVMTVHQAKGLEFPAVVLWDARAGLTGRVSGAPWKVTPDGRSWSIGLRDLQVNEPADLDLGQREKTYLDEERRRLVYVAATRARDLLVVPQAGPVETKYICGILLDGDATDAMHCLDPYVQGTGAAWADVGVERADQVVASACELGREVTEEWAAAGAEAGKPRFRPVGVAREAHVEGRAEDPDEDEAQWKDRKGRHGKEFGIAVHRAIELCVRDETLMPEDGVKRAVREVRLTGLSDEAVADVKRALGALEREGLRREPSATLRLEYPVAGPSGEGEVLLGFVDLVSVDEEGMTVIDFKTDDPGGDPVAVKFPEYVRQVRTYVGLLRGAGVGGEGVVRCGLLFTADGEIRWVSE